MKKFYVVDMSGYVISAHKTIESANKAFVKIGKSVRGIDVVSKSTDIKIFKAGELFA